VRVTHERIEETAPPEVKPYEDDDDYRRDEFTFDFDREVYRARILDSERRAAYVLKLTAGPNDDDQLAEIRDYLIEHSKVRIIRAIDSRKGGYSKWPRRKRLGGWWR
jgi:hypothetical protein